MLTTLGGGDTVDEESDESIHSEKWGPKDYGVVITKPILAGTVAPLFLSIEDPSTQSAMDPSALDALLVLSAKDLLLKML